MQPDHIIAKDIRTKIMASMPSDFSKIVFNEHNKMTEIDTPKNIRKHEKIIVKILPIHPPLFKSFF